LDYFIVQMNASPLRSVLALATTVLLASTPSSPADLVTRKGGPAVEGTIVGTKQGAIRVKVGNAETSIRLADVQAIKMDPPADLAKASAELAAGDAKDAATVLQRLNENFAGLPVPWAEQAAALLGDARLAAGDKAGAQAAYEQFRKTYPQAIALANLGMARLAVDARQFDEAGKLLDPMLADSAKAVLPKPQEGAALSQAHYLMGRVCEADQDFRAALAHYLKASAVFPFDENTVAEAQKRADALRAEHAGLIAP